MPRLLNDAQLSTIARALKGGNAFDVAVLEDEKTGVGQIDRNTTNAATALNKTGGAKTVNQNVLRVVQHVGLFLRSKGVANF